MLRLDCHSSGASFPNTMFALAIIRGVGHYLFYFVLSLLLLFYSFFNLYFFWLLFSLFCSLGLGGMRVVTLVGGGGGGTAALRGLFQPGVCD